MTSTSSRCPNLANCRHDSPGVSVRSCAPATHTPVPAGSLSPLPHSSITDKGSRVTAGTLRRRLYSWVRESRIKKADLKPHDLKRTFGTWYLQENPGQLIELTELMSHANLSQVRKYALSDAERARAGVAKL